MNMPEIHKSFTNKLKFFLAVVPLVFLPTGLLADNSSEDLAKKLSNPIASLISLPFQLNYDRGYNSADSGEKVFMNVQPVIPFALNDQWNVISRTIIPIVNQTDIGVGTGTQFGLGDIVQSVFLSPSQPTKSGLIWGAGAVFLLPTATDDLLGSGQFGIGPTAVVLMQKGPWTYGGLANHIWSVAGDSNRPDVNATFLQPFVSYTTPEAWTYSLNAEGTYNWETEAWSVPVNVTVAKLVNINGRPISLKAGLRYWAETPANGPDGLGGRLEVTYLFPK